MQFQTNEALYVQFIHSMKLRMVIYLTTTKKAIGCYGHFILSVALSMIDVILVIYEANMQSCSKVAACDMCRWRSVVSLHFDVLF